jgi:hypothetical protein
MNSNGYGKAAIVVLYGSTKGCSTRERLVGCGSVAWLNGDPSESNIERLRGERGVVLELACHEVVWGEVTGKVAEDVVVAGCDATDVE